MGRIKDAVMAWRARRVMPGVAALALTIMPVAAHAQIEEVRVEARGQEESVREIPVAITAVDSKTLENFSLNSLSDVAAHTPSLEILRIQSGTGTSISIRGISSSADGSPPGAAGGGRGACRSGPA